MGLNQPWLHSLQFQSRTGQNWTNAPGTFDGGLMAAAALDCFIFSGCSLRTAQFHKLAVGRALTHLEAMQQNRELSSCCHGDLGRLKRTLVIMTVKISYFRCWALPSNHLTSETCLALLLFHTRETKLLNNSPESSPRVEVPFPKWCDIFCPSIFAAP